MTAPDAALLISFAETRDEAAFRALAERHLPLIFHTALRRTRNRTLAEEIAQNVLCAMARKARELARHPGRIVPWLHRATLFECTTAMRKEATRLRRQRMIHSDDFAALETSEAALWQKALSHLDLALDRLSEADRRVLLLHFFEKLPFPKIAAQLGQSPAAVQKRSVRALEKLAGLLKSGGIAVPVAVIAAGLTAESAKAAPAALLSSCTASALAASSGATSSTLTLMIASHPKWFAACGLLLLALPLASQEYAIAEARKQITALRPNSNAPEATTVSVSQPKRTPSIISPSLDILQLAEEAAKASRMETIRIALDRKLSSIAPAELVDLLAAVKTAEIGEDKRRDLAEMIATALMAKDPAAAMEAVTSRGWAAKYWAASLFGTWLDSDSFAAKEWLKRQQERNPEAFGLAQYAGLSEQQETERAENVSAYGKGPTLPLQGALLKKLITSHSGEAIEYLKSFPSESCRVDVFLSAMGNGPRHFEGDPQVYLSIMREALPAASHDEVLNRLTTQYEHNYSGIFRLDPAVYDPLILAPGISGEEQRTIATLLATRMTRGNSYPSDPSQGSRTEAWLNRVVPDQAAEITAQARAGVNALTDDENTRTFNYYTNLTWQPSDDDMVKALSSSDFRRQMPQALALAARIRNPEKREAAIRKLEENAKR